MAGWIGPETRLEQMVSINREDMTVLVELRGLDRPATDETDLEERIQPVLPGYTVLVQLFRTEEATTTTLAPPEPTEQLLAEIRVEVEAWLATGDIEYQIDNITLNDSLVRIDATGTGDPPEINDLVARLTELNETLSPGLNWSTLETFTETTLPSQDELDLIDMRTAVDVWASQRNLVVRSVDYDGETVEVDVLGPVEPDIARLELELRQVIGEDVPVLVFFTQRLQVTTTTRPDTPVQTQ